MIIIGVTNLDEFVVSTITTSAKGDVFSLRFGIHWVYIFQSTLESAILRVSSYIFLSSSKKKCLLEDSLFILWFTAFGIDFSIDLGWLELTFM